MSPDLHRTNLIYSGFLTTYYEAAITLKRTKMKPVRQCKPVAKTAHKKSIERRLERYLLDEKSLWTCRKEMVCWSAVQIITRKRCINAQGSAKLSWLMVNVLRETALSPCTRHAESHFARQLSHIWFDLIWFDLIWFDFFGCCWWRLQRYITTYRTALLWPCGGSRNYSHHSADHQPAHIWNLVISVTT